MKRFVLALQIFFRFFPKYFAVIFICYAPWILTLKFFTGETLTAEASDGLAGLLSIFFMPFSNGIIVWLNQKHVEGGHASLQKAFSEVLPRWKDLFSAYISVGFIMIGWLLVAILPAGLIMMMFELKSPFWLAPTGAVAVIYVMSRYVFLDFFIILRGEAGWAARRHCPDLTRGRMLPIVTAVTLLAAPLLFSEFGFESLAMGLESATGVSMHLFVGAMSMASTLLYIVPQLYFYLLYREIT